MKTSPARNLPKLSYYYNDFNDVLITVNEHPILLLSQVRREPRYIQLTLGRLCEVDTFVPYLEDKQQLDETEYIRFKKQ